MLHLQDAPAGLLSIVFLAIVVLTGESPIINRTSRLSDSCAECSAVRICRRLLSYGVVILPGVGSQIKVFLMKWELKCLMGAVRSSAPVSYTCLSLDRQIEVQDIGQKTTCGNPGIQGLYNSPGDRANFVAGF